MKHSKNPRKNAELKACKAMSDYIRERDKWICITCGVKGTRNNIDAGHYLDRRYSDIKFDEKNVHAQCTRCNRGFTVGVWAIYHEKMQEKYNQEIIDNLMARRYIVKKRTIEEFLEIEKYFKDKLRELNNE